LKVNKGLALADFPQISDYPTTKRSLEIAGSIRATLNAFFGRPNVMAGDGVWPIEFWNRGLEISSCEFSHDND